jgi:DNA helicase-2/ATP-dependent DNA helicase PcrA
MVGGTSYFSLDSGRVDDDGLGRTFGDFAVLYRLNALSQPLVEAFERSGIPFQTVGQTPFYEQKEVKAILVYLWFVYNPNSRLHLEMILERGQSTVEALAAYAGENDLSLWEAVQQVDRLTALNKGQKKRLKFLAAFLAQLKADAETQSVAQLVERIQQHLSPTEKPAEQIRQLIRSAVPFEDRLHDFLAVTALQKETDGYDPRADRVTLMTLHAAKGLEFPVVFIVGCEETLLPYQMDGKETDIEEERRLFYVGMTGAAEAHPQPC